MFLYVLARVSSLLECACRRRRSGCLNEANPAGTEKGRADRRELEDGVLEVIPAACRGSRPVGKRTPLAIARASIGVVAVDDLADFALEFIHCRLLSGWCFVWFDFPDNLVADVGGVLVRPVHVPRIELRAQTLATASRLTRFARSANLIVFGDRRIFDAVLRQLVVVLRLKDEQFAAGLCDGSERPVGLRPDHLDFVFASRRFDSFVVPTPHIMAYRFDYIQRVSEL